MKNLLRAFVLLMLATSFAAGMTASVSAEAQSPSSQKRVVKIDDSTGELVDITQAQEVAPSQAPGIVILNNQKSTQTTGQSAKQAQTTIQDQPTNVIEDSPLNMSAAERRRRDRQNLEMQTEQKIVEKLEDARIEDERARSERLFNKGFGARDEKQEQAAPAPAPQQVQVIQAPPPVVVEKVVEKKEEPKVNVKEEIRAALDEMKPKHEEPTTGYYMHGLAGVGQYPAASNVRGDMALGFGFGIVTPERIVAEGTFQYSQYSVTDPTSTSYYQPNYGSSIPFTKVNQYNFQAAVKYQLLGGRVRPVVGLIAGYTYRSYEGQNSLYTQYYGSGYSNSASASTNALDVGALAGLDVQVTNTFSIGGDFRYMKNVAYRGNNDYSNAYALPAPFKRLEEINYYLASLVGKFTF